MAKRQNLTRNKKQTHRLLNEVNGVADEINSILNGNQKERYLEGIILLYSFIEALLRWLAFVQIIWNKSTNDLMPEGEFLETKQHCNTLNFYGLVRLASAVGLLDYKLFKRIESVRIERNTIVHQYWLYIHKGKRHILRKKLEKLAGIANEMVESLNKLVEETGMDESYGTFDVTSGKALLP